MVLFVGSILKSSPHRHNRHTIPSIKCAQKLFATIQSSSISVSTFVFFLICIGMQRCILLKFAAVFASSNMLNSNILRSNQLGEAYALCGSTLKI